VTFRRAGEARVDLASGNITFLDARSKVILAEKSRGFSRLWFRGNPRSRSATMEWERGGITLWLGKSIGIDGHQGI